MLDARTIQGPKGNLFTGSISDFARDPLGYLLSVAKDYDEIARMRFVLMNMYLVNQPDYIREILVTKHHAFQKGRVLQLSKPVLGEGLLTSEGDTHLRHRRMLQPAFHMRRVSEYADTMVEHVQRMMATWQDGEIRMMTEDMMNVTLRIIAETMFGFETLESTKQIGRAIDVLLEGVIHKTRSAFPLIDFIPTKRRRQFREAKVALDDMIYQIVSARRGEGEQHDRSDLLSMLIQARDESDGQGLTDQEVRDQVMTIFLAGHETTANTLAWTWYLLAQHPEIERIFHAELDTVLARRKPTMADIASLVYTNQIIKESMRLYPAVWTVSYQATDDVQVGKWHFHRGDGFLISQYVMHRNPKYYEQPDVFNPARWTDEFQKRLPQFAYFPFGGGPRICIGNQFALMESALLLASIGQRYRLELVDYPVIPQPLITLRPKGGIRMRIIARQ